MHRIRIYVDTSVVGGTQDEEFQEASSAFFERVRDGAYTIAISQLMIDELNDAPQSVKDVLLAVPENSKEFIDITDEILQLAHSYIDHAALPPKCFEDAIHVAAASVSEAEVILSWNFRHIVNYDRIRMFNSVNLATGYRQIDIRSPLEMRHETED